MSIFFTAFSSFSCFSIIGFQVLQYIPTTLNNALSTLNLSFYNTCYIIKMSYSLFRLVIIVFYPRSVPLHMLLEYKKIHQLYLQVLWSQNDQLNRMIFLQSFFMFFFLVFYASITYPYIIDIMTCFYFHPA